MAALPYMPMWWGDYLADTMHLSTEAHGAYMLIMAAYWNGGEALAADDLPSITKLNERWTQVEPKLQRYFNITPNGFWQHDRIDQEIAKATAKIVKASAAGRASAKKRAKTQHGGNKRSTDVEPKLQLQGNQSEPESYKDIIVINGVPEKHQGYFDHLVLKHGYCNHKHSAFNKKNLTQVKAWHMEAVTLAEIDAAIGAAKKQKPNEPQPNLGYLAAIVAGNRQEATPIPAGKNRTAKTPRNFDQTDYRAGAEKFKTIDAPEPEATR